MVLRVLLLFSFLPVALFAKSPSKTQINFEKIANQAHEVYTESWRSLFGRTQSVPKSIFQDFGLSLDRAKIDKKTKCKNKIYSTEEKDNVVSVGIRTCKGNQFEPHYRIIHLSSFEVDFIAEVANLNRIVGGSVSLLGRNIICRMKMTDKNKLIFMDCKNLGQNISNTEHVEFKKFVYDSSATEIIKGEADRYVQLTEKQLCDSAQPCLRLSVPNVGKIKVIEDRKRKQDVKQVREIVFSDSEKPKVKDGQNLSTQKLKSNSGRTKQKHVTDKKSSESGNSELDSGQQEDDSHNDAEAAEDQNEQEKGSGENEVEASEEKTNNKDSEESAKENSEENIEKENNEAEIKAESREEQSDEQNTNRRNGPPIPAGGYPKFEFRGREL